MSTPVPEPTAPTESQGIRTLLKRYQVMALVTSSFLLLVTAGVVVKYVFQVANETFLQINSIVGQVHGLIYIVYLVTAIGLWARMRWDLGRLALLLLGGVIPVLGFWAERRVSTEVKGSVTA